MSRIRLFVFLANSSALALVLAASRPCFAEEDPSATVQAQEPSESFHPRLVGDIRAVTLIHSSNNYFDHASTFGYDLSNAASGVGLTLGAELLPRVSLLAEGFYVVTGADRSDAQLRLYSGAVLGVVRWSFLRWASRSDDVGIDLAASAGFGRYLMKETFVDPSLSPERFVHRDGSFGGLGSIEASVTFHAFRGAIGYAFHYAPATITDRIGGSVYAGGHEIYLGVGVCL
jgi:hypothetical protein